MPTPEEILSDADAAARQFAIGLASQKGTSGIRPPPQIEVSEVTLDPKKFKIDLDRSADAAEAGDEGGGGGPIIEPEGACCQEDGSCDDIGELACNDAGGEWQGEGTTCDETTCPVHEGACCVETSCTILTPSDCSAAGGTYQGDGTLCDPDPCVATGACCQSDGSCTLETSDDCAAIPGIYQGDGTNCGVPCLTHTGCDCHDPIFQQVCNWGEHGCLCCAGSGGTFWQCCITTEDGPLGGPGIPFCCDGVLHVCAPHGCIGVEE